MTASYQNNRTKQALSALAVLSCTIAAAYWLWMTRSSGGIGEGAAKTTPTESKTELATATATPVDEATRALSTREESVKIFEAIESTNVSIRFWGKVVDQDGHPLNGVRVKYDYSIEHGNLSGVAWSEQERRTGEAVSDNDGLFAIQELKGHVLAILTAEKADYQFRNKGAMSFDFYGSTASGKFLPDQGKPVIFTMVHKQRLEPLTHLDGSFHVRGDGIPERWNLWSGEADPSGELAVSFRADPGVSATPAQIVNWSADLEIVGGGITEAPWDEEVRRAPESGYLATVFYPKAEQKQGVPHRSFYLRTRDGKYGRIQVEISTSHDGRTARCFITGDMNPRPGSRNLEPTDE